MHALPRREQRVLAIDRSESMNETLDAAMQDVGAAGWELVSSVGRERHGHSHEFFLFFRKPLHGQ